MLAPAVAELDRVNDGTGHLPFIALWRYDEDR